MRNNLLEISNVKFENQKLIIDGEIIDTLIHGYELIELVNHGANGIILKAKEIVTKKEIALKIWLNRKEDSSEQAANEIAKIEALDENMYSPYLVHYRGSGFFGKYNYCAIDYLAPKQYVTLKEYIRNDFSLYERYQIIKQIISGLRYAHEHDIYHGDLHPKNIMVEKSSKQIKIIDFGTSFRDKDYSKKRDNILMLQTAEFVLGKYYNKDILMNVDCNILPANVIRLIIKAMSKIVVLISFWKEGKNEEVIRSIVLFCVLVPFFNLKALVKILFDDEDNSNGEYKKIFLDILIEYLIRIGIIVSEDIDRGKVINKYTALQKIFVNICNHSSQEVDIYTVCSYDEVKRFNENLYMENITEREELEKLLE